MENSLIGDDVVPAKAHAPAKSPSIKRIQTVEFARSDALSVTVVPQTGGEPGLEAACSLFFSINFDIPKHCSSGNASRRTLFRGVH